MLPTQGIKIALACAFAVLLWFSGWKVRDWQAKADALAASNKQVAALEKEKDASKDALAAAEKARAGKIAWLQAESTALESDLAALRLQKQKTIIKRVEYEKPIYSSCILPVDGLRSINAGIAAINQTRIARERVGKVQ